MGLVGVVGAGVMGTGVAQSLAMAEHDVLLIDVSEGVLAQARDTIHQNCRMSRLTGGPDVDADKAMAKISTAVGLDGLAEADIVIENIVEDWTAKRELYPRLDGVCHERCVFVANTSAIPITRIAAITQRPSHVIGVHFMNPVPMKPAVELIPGYHTSQETTVRVQELLHGMGKQVIPVNDSCGFVSNRVLMLTVNEAAFLVHEGIGSAETVDEVFRSCFGHPMGPLETADLIGVDTILLSVEVLYEHYADSKYRPCPLLRQMVDAGLLGRKTGKGFHTYGPQRAVRPATDLS
jgi:3-hydroxybutyryl-CoA dehydrogenase